MHNVIFVKVGYCVQDLANDLCGILLGEFSVLANAVKELSTGGKLRDDIVLVLKGVLEKKKEKKRAHNNAGVHLTLDSNQSTKATMWGWLSLCKSASSS